MLTPLFPAARFEFEQRLTELRQNMSADAFATTPACFTASRNILAP